MIERIAINLLPAEYRVHKKTLQLRREVVYPILGVGIAWCGLVAWDFKIDTTINEVRNDIAATDRTIQTNKPIKDEIVRLKDGKNVIQGKIIALEQISVEKAKWVRLMEVLCQRLPEYTWINSCEEKDSSLFIEGSTFSFPEVANFMSRLSESAYIRSVDLSGIEEKETKVFSFSLACRLNAKPVIKDAAPDNAAMAEAKKGDER
jgi:Tfp pilus assembly protein PilN